MLVLQRLLHSPSSIAAALNMAGEEMIAVQGLDLVLLEEHRQRLWFYYAGHDDWVGLEKNKLLSSFYPDERSQRIVQDESEIPHAFCISKTFPPFFHAKDNFKNIYFRSWRPTC